MTPLARPPRATYRLQFNRTFTFGDAAALVDYIAALGVSHIYASPFLKARPGSSHGYDIIDHGALNPEIGDEAALDDLVRRCADAGMRLILDFVPNHMGVAGKDNAWWLDVLEWGQASPYAPFFDIDWEASRRDMRGKVLLPVLGDQYGKVLESGDLRIAFDAENGSFSAWYWEHRFPIAPPDYPDILDRADAGAGLQPIAAALRNLDHRAAAPSEHHAIRERARRCQAELGARARADPEQQRALAAAAESFTGAAGDRASWQDLHALLERQAYRVAYWRVAADEINYRRFFNINDLAGLRIELPALFEAAHRLVFRLVDEGKLDGLRIDHIDGLFDPAQYCERLQERRSAPLYVVVEKILAHHERLPDWPVAGTTGYEFANQVLGLFVDPAGEGAMTRLYERFTGRLKPFDDVLYESKNRIMDVNLASEMNVLAREFHRLSASHWSSRDFTLNAMRAALQEIIACFPVYRTYVGPRGAAAEDRRYIDWAVAQAKARSPAADTSIFDFVQQVLTADLAGAGYDGGEVLRLAMKFQQVTGPVTAKGFEDTALYRFHRLVALNEVGGDPRRFGQSPAAFHQVTSERVRRWPQALLATATHDTKRGEDARMRIALLSEMPREWGRRVTAWARFNRSRRSEVDGRAAPERNHEYLFYQALVGSWPLDGDVAAADLAARMDAFMIKAVREGKERSSWANPHADYEAAVQRFVRGALNTDRRNPFLDDVGAFLQRIARLAAINSLAQTLIKLTAPGAPDIYQGCELWDFSLVDPDNRRPVDWRVRRALLERLERDCSDTPCDLAAVSADWRSGSEKLFLIWRALRLRQEQAELFAEGEYVPLVLEGARAANVIAFARRRGDAMVLAIAPRLVGGLYGSAERPDWADTGLVLPAERSWRDVLSGRVVAPGAARIGLGEALADFPVGLLVAT